MLKWNIALLVLLLSLGHSGYAVETVNIPSFRIGCGFQVHSTVQYNYYLYYGLDEVSDDLIIRISTALPNSMERHTTYYGHLNDNSTGDSDEKVGATFGMLIKDPTHRKTKKEDYPINRYHYRLHSKTNMSLVFSKKDWEKIENFNIGSNKTQETPPKKTPKENPEIQFWLLDLNWPDEKKRMRMYGDGTTEICRLECVNQTACSNIP